MIERTPKSSLLDEHLRLKLADLSPERFEHFFLHFLNAGISLEIERGGVRIERKLIEANTYAAGTGRSQDGVDLIVKVEGGETWVFQCKRRKSWSPSLTETAVKKATGFPAQHYFLVVACDPHEGVQKLIARYPNWTFWNLDRICAEFRLRVPTTRQKQVLNFLQPEEFERFAPYFNDVLLPPSEYLSAINQSKRSFHHRYPLIGRKSELDELEAFASQSSQKVLILSAKGGEGKSRLLWEFANIFLQHHPEFDVAFLNPHSNGSISTALWDINAPKLLIVDDAHRLERVSHELLSCVCQSPVTKLVLATRPQGNEALEERLRDHVLEDKTLRIFLRPLKKDSVKELAKYTLGSEHLSLVEPLVARTGDSPFLTALAGDLLKRGKLDLASLSSGEGFYSSVLRSFEADNLAHLSAEDQVQGARMLRVIAMLTPVTPDSIFIARSAACLGVSDIEAEAIFQRLQGAGVISAEKDNIRVIPDLFSDFLVFDTAFGTQHKLPVFASKVLETFSDQSASLLRNLAEASWLARAETIERKDLLRPLLEAEFSRFDQLSFFGRGQMLEEWSAFSIYLPSESLQLARKAIAAKTAAPDRKGSWYTSFEGIHSYDYVISWIPALLKPVAKWHDDFRHEALDVLWNLGKPLKTHYGRNHPWEVIADILKFEPHKPISVCRSVIEWVAKLVRRPDAQELIESPHQILSILLKPCFDREMEFTEWRGREVRWWRLPINIEPTAELRSLALKVLQWVVDNLSWRAAIDVIGVLTHPLRRVIGSEIANADGDKSLMDDWRPERLKALTMFRDIIQKHPCAPVRFAIRQWLLRDLGYEEDTVFAREVRNFLSEIKEDLNLLLAIATLTEGHYEFSELLDNPREDMPKEKSEELWNAKLKNIAERFIDDCSTVAIGIDLLESLYIDFTAAGYYPRYIYLFPAVAQINSNYAFRMAEALIRMKGSKSISLSWYQFLFVDDGLTEGKKLLELAKSSLSPEVRVGVIHYLCFRNRGNASLSQPEKQMVEAMVAQAERVEILKMLQLIQWLDPLDAAWGYHLLEILPLQAVADDYKELFNALYPYRAKNSSPPLSTVEHVLNAIEHVPEIELDHSEREFAKITEAFPVAVYDFIVRRILYSEKLSDDKSFRPLPTNIQRRFRMSALSNSERYGSICEYLWNQVATRIGQPTVHAWIQLLQGVGLENFQYWLPSLIGEIKSASTIDRLRDLVDIINFDGSLVIFKFPEMTSAFLQRADDIEGTVGVKRMRSCLYSASGPRGRSFTNGVLDSDDDYLEAEAFELAEQYAGDPILGPFYKWIGEVERHDQEFHKKLNDADMALLDE